MRRVLSYFLRTAAVVAVILVGVVAALFIPAVQKFLLIRALSGPDSEVSVETVSIRPGSAILEEFSLETPETRIQFENLDSRFRLGPLLFRRTVHVESLRISDLLVETEESDEPPETDPWAAFDGLLVAPPLDFRVEAMEIDGTARSPSGTAVEFGVNGRELTSRGGDGQIDANLNIEDENLPGGGRWIAEITVRPEFDGDGIFQELAAELALREPSEPAPLIHSNFSAARTKTGESYRLEVARPEGDRPRYLLLAAIGDWSRTNDEASGLVDIDLARDLLPIDAERDGLPDFSLSGQTEFVLSKSGEIHLRSDTAAALSELAERYGMPDALDELAVDLSVNLTASRTHLALEALDIGIAEGAGVDLARVSAPSAFDFEIPEDGDWTLPETEEPLLLVDLPGLPPELIERFLSGLGFTADPVTAQFTLHARNDRLEIETPQPLTFQNLVLSGPEGAFLEESDIRITPSAQLSTSDFAVALEIAASLPQARSLSLALESSGPLPLTGTVSEIRIEGSGLSTEFPFSDLLLTGSVDTAHANDNPVPERLRFDLAGEGTLRADAPPHLPGRIAADGGLTREADGFAYEMNVGLPEPDGTQTPPALAVAGAARPDGSRIDGTLATRLPEWWAREFAAARENLGGLRASADLAYDGSLAPLDLRIDSSTALAVDTGRTDLPGDGRFSLTTEGAGRLNETAEVNAFRAAVSAEGGDALLTATLRQPIAFREDGTVFDLLPQGELLAIDFGALRVDEWIPEEQRNGVSGGDVRGGFRVLREADVLHVRPAGENIEIAGIHPGTFDGREIAAVDLTLHPFARVDEEVLHFGLEPAVLATGGVPILEATLSGGMPFNAPDEEPRQLTGTLALNGDLASAKNLLGDDYFPRLQQGTFDLGAEVTADPDNLRSSWTGTLSIPELTGDAAESVFAVTTEFDGETSASGARGRVIGEIDNGGAVQDLELVFESDRPSDGSLPRLDIRGTSDFLDLIRLEALAGVFASDSEPADGAAEEAPPGESDSIAALLPVDLHSEFTVARLHVLPDFDVFDVLVDITGDQKTLDLRRAEARFLDNAEVAVTGILSANGNSFGFVSTGRGTNIDIAELLRRTQGVADPDIDGVFAFNYEASSRAPDLRTLSRNIDGLLSVSGRQGRLKLTVPDERVERIRRIAGMQEGAIGSAIARIAGAPPGVQALADSINLLTNIPYDSLEARMGMVDGRTLVVERLELAGPYLYAGGTGRLENLDFDAVEETQLDLQVQIGARNDLREQFRILRLLSNQRNESGYDMLRQRPVAVTGTVGEPNLREVWDLLIQAGAGAATARDEPSERQREREPVEDAVEGLRDLFGW